MISAAKLHQLSNFNADQLTEMMGEDGYDVVDEPFITTYFQGVSVNGSDLDFLYEAQYVHVDGGLQFAHIVITYDTVLSKVSADYA
jgi:hypothetical protein